MTRRTTLLVTYTRQSRVGALSTRLDAFADDVRQSPGCLACDKSRRPDGAWQVRCEWRVEAVQSAASWERWVMKLHRALSLPG
ncbi:hypothetical protein ACIPL1_30030 [Pseudomonas sp. NPDC090202]|uniref:hypothetical protein n=1 Tax=unclassified Pseudomonas TaxID=196821 RepID=UPI003814239C